MTTPPIPKIPLVRAGRDLRVDFFRGLALWMIFVNHTPGNIAGEFTLRKVSLSDATEIFVLLAGYAAGLAYGRMLDRDGWLHTGARIVERIFTLYVAHIFLFVVFTAQVGFSAAALDQAAYFDELALDPFTQEPYRALLEALLLRYQPAFLDVLPLYIVVLALFALALPLIRRLRLLIGASVLMYALARGVGLAPPSWTGDGWFFNPFAWQLLFAIGIWLGRAETAMLSRWFGWNRWVAAALMALLLGNAFGMNLSREGLLFGIDAPEWLAGWYATIDKSGLHPARLASVLIMVWLAAHWVKPQAAWLNGYGASLFALLGQQGLPVFCAGIFLSFLGRVTIEVSESWHAQLLVNLGGLFALVGIAALVAWHEGGTRRKPDALPAANKVAKLSS
jgi:hypothetical protein